MQGRLTNEPITALLETSCAHCDEPMIIEIDSDLQCTPRTTGAQPMVSVPIVDDRKLGNSRILDAV